MQPQVNMNSLLLQLTLHPRLLNPLRPRQIHQMNRRLALDVAARFGSLKLDDENAVGSGGLVVFGCFTNLTVHVAQ